MKVRLKGDDLPRYERAKLRLFLTAGTPVTVTVVTRDRGAAAARIEALAATVADIATVVYDGRVSAVFTPRSGGDPTPVREPRSPTPPQKTGRHHVPLPVPCLT